MPNFFPQRCTAAVGVCVGLVEASCSQPPEIPLQMNGRDVIPLNPVSCSLFANERKLRSAKNQYEKMSMCHGC